MSASKLQATQTVLHDVLSELNNAADEQLDSILGKINTSLKVPGLLSLGSGLVVNVGSTTLVLPNGTNARLVLGDVDIGGLSGSMDFATGIGSGDVQNASWPPVFTASQWYKAGFEVRADQNIYVVFGAIGASESAAGFPNWTEVSLALGYISLQVNGGGSAFNTPSASAINQFDKGGSGAAQLSDHTLLTGRSTANQHPTTAVATTTAEFSGNHELSATEDEVQKALVRLGKYDSIFDWTDGYSYRVGNAVKAAGTYGTSLYRCITAHTASGSIDNAKFELIVSAQNHDTLANKNAASQHPTTSISTTTGGFTDFFRSAEDEVQKALDRVDDYTSIRAYASGNVYRINNVVVQNGSQWRCTVDNTSGSFNESDWTLLVDAPSFEVQTVSAPGGASGFTMSSITIPTATSKLMVFVNGIYQIETTHYTVTPPTAVNFTSVLPQNAQVVFRLS